MIDSSGGTSRALHVCHMIHSLQPGGAEQALVELAAVTASVGLQMTVVSLTSSDDHDRVVQLRRHGADVVVLDLPGRWDPRALERATSVVRRIAPDVVHTHLKHADIVGGYARRRLRIPMVSTLHLVEDGTDPLTRAKRWAGVTVRERSAAVTIAVSDALRQWYLATFPVSPERVVTIHNGVAPLDPATQEEAATARAELGVAPSSVLVVMVGIMRPGKGHADLLEAVRLLPPDSPIHVAMIGDGPLAGRLVESAAGLPCPVTFTGFRHDVARLLAAADLVVHPAHFDALPTALIEALRAGRPIVASDVGGVPEVVTQDVGRLVPAADPRQLARAMSDLAADPPLRRRLGEAGRRRFAAEFDARQWAARLRRAYEGALVER